MVLLTAGSATAQQPGVDDDEVKAAFLYRLSMFTHWPERPQTAPGMPLTFCVLGNEPLGTLLRRISAGKTSQDRPIAVRLAGQDELHACDVLFVGADVDQELDRLLLAVAGRPTLVVGEEEGFALRGGMVNLVREGRHLRLEVNLDALGRAGLRLSSHVLVLAHIVRP